MTDNSNQESTLPSTKDTPPWARNDTSFQRKKEVNLAVRKEQTRNQRYGQREETPRRQRQEETERGSWTIELNTGSPVSEKQGDARDKDREEGIGEDSSRPVHKEVQETGKKKGQEGNKKNDPPKNNSKANKKETLKTSWADKLVKNDAIAKSSSSWANKYLPPPDEMERWNFQKQKEELERKWKEQEMEAQARMPKQKKSNSKKRVRDEVLDCFRGGGGGRGRGRGLTGRGVGLSSRPSGLPRADTWQDVSDS